MRLFRFSAPALLLILLFTSCSPSRRISGSVTPASGIPSYAADYISRYGSLAVGEMKRTGIPASITLAQGMLESDYGRSSLARRANNHFGIKCHNDWRGPRVYQDDDRRNECFRSYRSVEESYRDHSDFLINGSRYKELFSLSSTDYKGWAHGLKKAGYATNPKYPSLLIGKIEEYGLHIYDNPKAAPAPALSQPDDAVKVTPQDQRTEGQPDTGNAVTAPAEPPTVITLSTGRVAENNNVQYIVVKEGDTYESLAREFDLLSWEIRKYNDLLQDQPLTPGQMLYLQPKRAKAAFGITVHVVSEGETMYSLSQKYAVKLSSLYKLNMMKEGDECTPGQKLKLR